MFVFIVIKLYKTNNMEKKFEIIEVDGATLVINTTEVEKIEASDFIILRISGEFTREVAREISTALKKVCGEDKKFLIVPEKIRYCLFKEIIK